MSGVTQWTKARWAALSVVALLGICAVAVATGAGADGSGDQQTEIAAADAPEVTAVEPEQAEAIEELDRAERPDDDLHQRW